MKKFNQARVNGGSNYDSLNLYIIGEDRWDLLTAGLCHLVEACTLVCETRGSAFAAEKALRDQLVRGRPVERRLANKSISHVAE